jgi:sigma-B regulation protein RsbU (phosphoserine phosphatase)
MDSATATVLQRQMLDRRERLQTAISQAPRPSHLVSLLQQVDSALERMNHGSYGLCTVCHDPIEEDRLLADPLIQTCLDHLTPNEIKALEQDLNLASKIQENFLPKKDIRLAGWEVTYHYEPAGAVSGDYCDIIPPNGKSDLFFILGDVSGKGIGASMLMAHLKAIFHTLIDAEMPLDQLIEQANRIFCNSTLPTHYATLVFGKSRPSGELSICNAGHCFPILLRPDGIVSLEENGLPLGLLSQGKYVATNVRLTAGESLFLYTDGLTETINQQDHQYGVERLSKLLATSGALPAKTLIEACLRDLASFRDGGEKADDLTIMVIRRTN